MANAAQGGETSRLTKYQKFRGARVHRSQLKNAPYNPREPLHPVLAQRLRENLQTVGLVEPLTWNERTGLLVGGHQRLAALDVLTGHGDYELDVALVDLDPQVERQQNVFLNNQAVQGDWDTNALINLFKSPGFDVVASGFHEIDVLDIFGEQIYTDLFPNSPPFEPDPPQRGKNKKPPQPIDPEPAGPEGEQEEDVLLVLFASRADRERFMELMGCEPDERYIDAARVLAELGVDTNESWGKALEPARGRA